jgi:hypothetical protein
MITHGADMDPETRLLLRVIAERVDKANMFLFFIACCQLVQCAHALSHP